MQRIIFSIIAILLIALPWPRLVQAATDVTVTLTTQAQNFPAGTVAGSFKFEILNSVDKSSVTGVEPIVDPKLQQTFLAVPDGSYVACAEVLESTNTTILPSTTQVCSTAFTLPPPPVAIQVPFSIQISTP